MALVPVTFPYHGEGAREPALSLSKACPELVEGSLAFGDRGRKQTGDLPFFMDLGREGPSTAEVLSGGKL